MRGALQGRQLAALRCSLFRYLIALKTFAGPFSAVSTTPSRSNILRASHVVFVHALMEICTWFYSFVTTFRTLNTLRLFTKARMDGYPAGGWGDSNEPESRSSFRAVPVLAHQPRSAGYPSTRAGRVGVASGEAVWLALLRVPRRQAHGSAGTWKVCRLACHCELFHKTGNRARAR